VTFIPPRSPGRSAAKPPGGGEQSQISRASQSARSETRLKAASPLARRLAAESGIDLAAVAGTGPEGAVQAADLPETSSGESEVEVGRTWRIMAERTATAWTAPHFFLTREVMAEPLIAFRADLAEKGEKVTVTDLLVKLSALTLKRHPHAAPHGARVDWSKVHGSRSASPSHPRTASRCRSCRTRTANPSPR